MAKAEPLKLTQTGYKSCAPAEASHLRFRKPGPFPTLILPVMIGGTRKGTPNWTWNGSVDAPTLKPSVITRSPHQGIVCHSWINDGKVQFLNDCTHEHAGKTMDLLDVDDASDAECGG